MFSVTVLSPHRDDAVFSIGLALARWSAEGASISVINFFTRSAYAPRAPGTAEAVSRLRKHEDRVALRHVAPGARIRDEELLDAPLRLGIDVSQICSEQAQRLVRIEEVQAITAVVNNIGSAGLVIAPLALGNHVDHLLINRAAIEAKRGRTFAYYEDLPYASWKLESDIQSRVREIERTLCSKLRPIVIRSRNATRRKLRLVGAYESQITTTEARSITSFATRYGGERIWCPTYSKSWNRFFCD